MKSRVYGLDLLRFIAAMVVLFFHYTFRGYTADGLSPTSFPLAASFFRYGYLGVDLFFMISGFVILMSARSATLKSFIASRIGRLYPAYWVAVTLSSLAVVFIGVHPFTVTLRQYLTNLTMLNEYIGVESVDGVYWSLAVELKFYLLICMILWSGKMAYITELAVGWLLISVLACIVPHHSIICDAIRAVFLTDWSSYFIAGMLLYLIKEEGVSILKGLLLACCFCLSAYLAVIRMGGYQVHFATHYSKPVLIAIIASFYAAMLLLSLGRLDFLNRRLWVRAGALTYPLYLIHQLIGYILFYRFAAYNKYAVLSTIILLMLAISYLIHRYVEKTLGPILRRAIDDL
jgi:peptidoglycan/LPS O-acetylase OafA/YrhL